MIEPLVTVNILSFNRKDDLRVTLTKVFEQDYKNIEIIVVDNASTDGSVEMINSFFPSVHMIVLKKNIGIAGWNEGFKIAKGEYILVLDDDSYPEVGSLTIGVKKLQYDQTCGLFAMSVFNYSDNIYQTKYLEKGYVRTFIGCGAIIRKTMFTITGYFSELLFIYAHEDEYSMRIIDNGFTIYYDPDSMVSHRSSLINRKILSKNSIDTRRVYYSTRNTLIILCLHFSCRNIIFRLIRIIAGRLIAGLKNDIGLVIIKAVVGWLRLLPKIMINRKVLNESTQEIYEHGGLFGGFYFSDGHYFLK